MAGCVVHQTFKAAGILESRDDLGKRRLDFHTRKERLGFIRGDIPFPQIPEKTRDERRGEERKGKKRKGEDKREKERRREERREKEITKSCIARLNNII